MADLEPEDRDRRIWAKIDVDYFDNPKIDALSDAAQLLHMSLILKAKKQRLGGVLSARTCKVRGDSPLRELVDGDLLHKIDARSYQLHDYGKHQTDEAELSRKRTASGGRGGHVKNHVNRVRYSEDCEHCQKDAADDADWLKKPGLTLIQAS